MLKTPFQRAQEIIDINEKWRKALTPEATGTVPFDRALKQFVNADAFKRAANILGKSPLYNANFGARMMRRIYRRLNNPQVRDAYDAILRGETTDPLQGIPQKIALPPTPAPTPVSVPVPEPAHAAPQPAAAPKPVAPEPERVQAAPKPTPKPAGKLAPSVDTKVAPKVATGEITKKNARLLMKLKGMSTGKLVATAGIGLFLFSWATQGHKTYNGTAAEKGQKMI